MSAPEVLLGHRAAPDGGSGPHGGPGSGRDGGAGGGPDSGGGATGLLPQLLLALVCGGYATGAALGWGSREVALFMGDFGLSIAAFIAAVSCFLYARTDDSRFRPAWLLFSLSSAMAAGGNAVWGWYEVVLDRPVPSPSLADLFFLCFAPPAIVGLLVLAKRPVSKAGWVCLCLDAWLIGGSLLTLSWSLALAHTTHFDGETVAHAALSLAYPLLDIVLVSMVLALHFRRSTGSRTAINSAIAALALTVLCDALFTSPLLRETYRSGQLLDAGWFAGSLLLAYAPGASAGPPRAPRSCRCPHASPGIPAGRSRAPWPPSRPISPPPCARSESCTTSSRAAASTAWWSSRAARSSSPWSYGRASCSSTTSRSPTNWPRRRTTSAPWSRDRATSS